MKRSKSGGIDKVRDKEIEKVGGINIELERLGITDKALLKEIWRVGKKRVKDDEVKVEHKLKALELIARIKGLLRETQVGVQQNVLFNLIADDDKVDRYIEEDEQVKKEI